MRTTNIFLPQKSTVDLRSGSVHVVDVVVFLERTIPTLDSLSPLDTAGLEAPIRVVTVLYYLSRLCRLQKSFAVGIA